MTPQTFWSRFTLAGDFTLETALRVGSSDGLALDANGQPLIPGSTFRGALRTYTEAALRGMYDPQRDKKVTVNLRGQDGRPMPVLRTVTLCCDSVDKRDDNANYQGCLTKAIVSKWENDPIVRPNLDQALADCSCQVCRLFGAVWLAGRVIVPDLTLVGGNWNGSQTRGGLALSRDRDISIKDSGYQREVVPAGLQFRFQLVAENVTPVEQGILMLGVRAFENGLVSLGGDRSRGLGRGRLELDWWNCRYIDADHLIGALLGNDVPLFTDSDAEARLSVLATELGKPNAPTGV
jgi:CRISPR/Cas system CSM-associated protein Csm3 (group 7 of RAMP superfamily)